MQDVLYRPDEKVHDEARQGEAFAPFANDPNTYRKKFYIESYGCQMNFSDSEIVASILQGEGFGATRNVDEADLVLLNTCSIREKAEQTIRHRLMHIKRNKKHRPGLLVGVLGCMAERLKGKLLEEEKLVDLVIGPDAYRTLPALIQEAEGGQKGVNVLLSREETYADIAPVRLDSNGVSAFVSIMRGCNNMCSFCVVPFTRGRERSRDAQSIIAECRNLFENGYREVTLLGQNVDSYQWSPSGTSQALPKGKSDHISLGLLNELSSNQSEDKSALNTEISIQSEKLSSLNEEIISFSKTSLPAGTLLQAAGDNLSTARLNSLSSNQDEGVDTQSELSLSTNSFPVGKDFGAVVDFARLLALVADISPLLRVRFSTSHPKDITDEVLHTMARYPNICKYIHLPVQSGNTRVLQLMNRTYTREWYLHKVRRIREIMPDCALSTDVITGFCTETEAEHADTVSLMSEVGYDLAYMFAYSERPGTLAARRFADDVPEEVKKRRLEEIIAVQNESSQMRYQKQIGKTVVVLIETTSKRSEAEWMGRSDDNKRVVFPKGEAGLKPGDYATVHITDATQATLRGVRV